MFVKVPIGSTDFISRAPDIPILITSTTGRRLAGAGSGGGQSSPLRHSATAIEGHHSDITSWRDGGRP